MAIIRRVAPARPADQRHLGRVAARRRAAARGRDRRGHRRSCSPRWPTSTRSRPRRLHPTLRANAATPPAWSGDRGAPRPGLPEPDRQRRVVQPARGKITVGGRRERRGRSAIDGPGARHPGRQVKAIFGRFYSDRPQGEKFGTHSGLGLSISKQIVEAHGGKIFAETMRRRNGIRPGPVCRAASGQLAAFLGTRR